MPQLVFIHGPGAGGCSDAWIQQLKHFPGSVAPTLPGNLIGSHCADITRYMEWVRGWLWAQGMTHNLVLVGYTLGAAIALQYALDYPDEVSGLVLSAVSIAPREEPRSGVLDNCLKAAQGDQQARDKWVKFNGLNMTWIEPSLREFLFKRHDAVGPMGQYKMLQAIFKFDVRDRIGTLKPKVLFIRGADDPLDPPQVEQELHDQLAGSKLVFLPKAGHFPATERPAEVNQLIEEFVAELS